MPFARLSGIIYFNNAKYLYFHLSWPASALDADRCSTEMWGWDGLSRFALRAIEDRGWRRSFLGSLSMLLKTEAERLFGAITLPE
jgi:hypothetical protein